MKAVIMAGGEGTRLRPLTCGIPKPMVPIINKPVMEYTIELLKKHGIRDIAVTMAYFPDVIVDYFGLGSDWDVNIKYYTEETPLGTGGSVKNAEDFLDGTFLIISGDALTNIDIEKAVKFHRQKGSKATLVLRKEPIPLEYGVVITDAEGKIIRFLEKPSWGEVFSDTINTGIYILEPEIFSYYKKGDNFDFSKDLFPKLLRDEVPMYGYISEEYWNDIGDLKVYKEVNFDVLTSRFDVKLPYTQIQEGIWTDENVIIEQGCNLEAPIFIGRNTIIRRGAYVYSSVIGEGCEIGNNSTIKKTILWNHVNIGNNVQCRGSVVCSNVNIKYGANLFENTVVGSRNTIMTGVMVRPDIKIWPEKTIEENAVVSQNLVWGTRVSKTLFGFRDITGDINIEISPEFASKLGSAFGSILNEDAKVVISTDSSNAAALVKDSIASGILSTGVKVIDIQKGLTTINRYAIRFLNAQGGIHIRKDYQDRNKVHIELMNKDGINIDRGTERKVENIFAREDFKRCIADRIKSTSNIDNFSEFYIQNGTNLASDIKGIKSKNPKIVVGSKSNDVVFMASSFLENLGCNVVPDYNYLNHGKTGDKNRNNFFADDGKDAGLPRDSYLYHIAEMVVKNGAKLGAVVDETGENVVLIDHQGRIVDEDKYLILTSLIALKADKSEKLTVPYTAPKVIDDMAKLYNKQVIRTKNAPSEIMKVMINSDRDKTVPAYQFIMNFDAIWGLGCIIDYLVANAQDLYELVDELPEFYMRKHAVDCDWKYKGKVIRELIEENKDNNIELFEGVKINTDKGWVLILPDSEKPVCNVYAEGYSEEYADELTDVFCKRISNIVEEEMRH